MGLYDVNEVVTVHVVAMVPNKKPTSKDWDFV